MDALAAQKEAFFSNLAGSTTLDVLCSLAVLPGSMVLLSAMQASLGPLPARWRFVLECLVLVLPLVLANLVPLPGFGAGLTACALAVSLGMAAGVAYEGGDGRPLLRWDAGRAAPEHALCSLHPSRPYFVTRFRAALMLLTVVVILGVDFSAFPRRMAKTESLGLSTMDAIVGAFAFSSGLTSFWARRLAGCTPATKSAAASGQVALLLALGALRLLAHSLTSHHAHSSEYGAHWNFYFTLALISLAGDGLGAVLCWLLRATAQAAKLPPPHPASRAGALFLLALALSLLQERAVLTAPLQSLSGVLGLPAAEALFPDFGANANDPVCSLPLGGPYARLSVAHWALCGKRTLRGHPATSLWDVLSGGASGGGGGGGSGAQLQQLLARLFVENREGILSLVGLFCLHIFGLCVGVLVAAAGLEADQARKEPAAAGSPASCPAPASPVTPTSPAAPASPAAPGAHAADATRARATVRVWHGLFFSLSVLCVALWALYAMLCSHSWEWASATNAAQSRAQVWPPPAAHPGGSILAHLTVPRNHAGFPLPPLDPSGAPAASDGGGANEAVVPPGFPVSRRLANTAYVLWCSAGCLTLLLAFCGVEAISVDPPQGGIMEAVSSNFLPTFILANLGVGAVNVLGDAAWGGCLHAPLWAAAPVTLIYTCTVLWVICGVFRRSFGGELF
jgi:hypothetical protein